MAAGLQQPAWDEAYRASARSLAILRVLFGAALLGLLLPRYQWIAGFPDEFFTPPPGPASLFGGFPTRAFFVGVDTVLITATVFLIAGRHVTVASIAITGALLTGNTWAYSFGKIDHDILLVLLPAFMAAAGWQGTGPTRARPMASYTLVVALAMATGAWQKLASGWLDPSASAVLGHSAAFSGSSNGWLWRAALEYLPLGGWKLLDYTTLAFESAFILVVFRATAFRALCGLGCLFHVVVGHMMRITFVSNLPAYAAFVDWEDLAVCGGVLAPIERLQRWLLGCRAWHLLAVSAALTFVYLRWGNAVQLTTTMLGPVPAAAADAGTVDCGWPRPDPRRVPAVSQNVNGDSRSTSRRHGRRCARGGAADQPRLPRRTLLQGRRSHQP